MQVKGGMESEYDAVVVELGDRNPDNPSKRVLVTYPRNLGTVGEVCEFICHFFRNEKWWRSEWTAANVEVSLKDGTELVANLRAVAALRAPEGHSYQTIFLKKRSDQEGRQAHGPDRRQEAHLKEEEEEEEEG